MTNVWCSVTCSRVYSLLNITVHIAIILMTLLYVGFHFSRCSYLLSLLRPHIYADLELKVHSDIETLHNELLSDLKDVSRFGPCLLPFTVMYLYLETWAEGVHERPTCFHPHVGGGGERCSTKVSHPGLRSGHEPEGDRQVLTEGCKGDVSIMIASAWTSSSSATLTLLFTHSLTCTQAYPDFVAHLEKLAGAIHPLLDAPPVDIPGVTTGSLGKRLAAAKTLTPLVKCGVLVDACLRDISICVFDARSKEYLHKQMLFFRCNRVMISAMLLNL